MWVETCMLNSIINPLLNLSNTMFWYKLKSIKFTIKLEQIKKEAMKCVLHISRLIYANEITHFNLLLY